jgi:hypothetical protein
MEVDLRTAIACGKSKFTEILYSSKKYNLLFKLDLKQTKSFAKLNLANYFSFLANIY